MNEASFGDWKMKYMTNPTTKIEPIDFGMAVSLLSSAMAVDTPWRTGGGVISLVGHRVLWPPDPISVGG